MDAKRMSFPSASRKNPKILQDLHNSRFFHSFASSSTPRPSSIMDSVRKLETLSPSSRKPLHVGIIGAGFAGLRCADILLRHGSRVTLLEARNRLGGRIHQERLPNGHLIDVGANWIHGTKDNPIYDLVVETKTPTGQLDEHTYVFDENGELLEVEESEELATVMWEVIEAGFRFSEERTGEIGEGSTLKEWFEKEIRERVPEGTMGWERRRRLLMQMAELWGNFVGSPLDRQSLKFFWLEECIEGENLFCAGTYHKVLEKVAQPARDGATIRLQTRVVEILGRSATHTGNVAVKTAAGQVLEFDHVVVTCPLGWLKRNLHAFHPPLPDRLCKAIGNIGYGNLEKVYLSFPTPFWLTPDPQTSQTVQGFCQWLAPTYAPQTNPNRWLIETVELASLPGPSAHSTLLFYTFGDQAAHITSTLRSLPDQKSREQFVFEYFRPYYSLLPSYDPQDKNCQPTAFFATDWEGDELAGNGSYANFMAGLTEADRDIEVMREGVPSEGVWIAGEHAAPFVALGTVTGAYWSGEGVGRRILDFSREGA